LAVIFVDGVGHRGVVAETEPAGGVHGHFCRIDERGQRELSHSCVRRFDPFAAVPQVRRVGEVCRDGDREGCVDEGCDVEDRCPTYRTQPEQDEDQELELHLAFRVFSLQL